MYIECKTGQSDRGEAFIGRASFSKTGRTIRYRELELKSAEHTYDAPGRYTLAVKVIDIFGNDTMTLVPITDG